MGVVYVPRSRSVPQWTPDGSKIVISHGGIYVVRSDGTGLERVIDNGGYVDISSDVSTEGLRIVYATTRHVSKCVAGTNDCSLRGRTRNFELETANIEGSDRRRLTENVDLDTAPVYSPDGSRIAYAKYSGVTFAGIYIVAPDGSDPRRLMSAIVSTRDEGDGSYIAALSLKGGPAWSPDGQKLAVVIEEAKSEYDETGHYSGTVDRTSLYVVSPDGSGLTRLFEASGRRTDSIDGIIGPPAWSPDGQTITFRYDMSRIERASGTAYYDS